jgi:hypothetical protein
MWGDMANLQVNARTWKHMRGDTANLQMNARAWNVRAETRSRLKAACLGGGIFPKK